MGGASQHNNKSASTKLIPRADMANRSNNVRMLMPAHPPGACPYRIHVEHCLASIVLGSMGPRRCTSMIFRIWCTLPRQQVQQKQQSPLHAHDMTMTTATTVPGRITGTTSIGGNNSSRSGGGSTSISRGSDNRSGTMTAASAAANSTGCSS